MDPKKQHQWTAVTTKRVSLAPINRLPSEILSRVFLLAVKSQTCPLRREDGYTFALTTLMHPESLLLVCSHWYNIVISSRPLWSHIDILLSCPQSRAFIKRAKAYAARAGHTLLDIHIVDPSGQPRHQIGWPWELEDSDSGSLDQNEEHAGNGSVDVTSFNDGTADGIKTDNFSSVSPTPMAIRSLELVVHYRYYVTHRLALEYYLSRCMPDTLTQILIRKIRPINLGRPLREPVNHFSEIAYVGNSSAKSAQDTKGRFGSLTTLRLKGLYPDWTSHLYHGLVNLWLEGRVYIPEHHLIDILRSSPRLRALRLDCWITEVFNVRENENGSYDEPPADVHFSDLEILDIHYLDLRNATRILRRLSYGPKPLQLGLSKTYSEGAISRIFQFSNWNVTELRVDCWSADELVGFLKQFPQTRSLVIGIWDESDFFPASSSMNNPPQSSLQWYRPGTKSHDIQLDTLCVARSFIYYDELRALVYFYSVQKLIIWLCKFKSSGGCAQPTDTELASLCPVVEVVKGDEPSPVMQWI